MDLSGVNTAIVILSLAFLGGFGGFMYWRGKVDSDRTSFKEFMKEIRADIKEIFNRLPPATATTGSPLRLTDLGQKISDAINGKEWAAQLAEGLAGKLEGKSPYEIQETCRKYCHDRLQMTEDQLALCGNAAYEHGVSLDQIRGVLGLELRDVLLKKFELTAPE